MNYITLTYPQTASIQFQGRMFNYVSQVFLSSGNITFPTLTSINNFTTNTLVSALFPAFSGYALPPTYFYNKGVNYFYVNIPSFNTSGNIDVILYNSAGYSSLSKHGYLIANIVR